ncbi:VWA domain-containing protein [Mycobacterium sp. 21AC1]|uniref:vWA domain-containing protein n=1 Tax=[Mycobacterium] appelbergii TaxID=2939269 RepID=UPI0029393AE6|nr:VWA domain-containing protein [Mycobacterium sp. 21AC1]MDV3126160.1 VWA domain-containing protein [Mycobacterium sp. 21AC1]
MTGTWAGEAKASGAPASWIEEHLARFLRTLRESGLSVTAPKQLDFLRAIESVAPTSERELYWIGLATLTTSRRDGEIYDPVFAHFFLASDLSVGPEPALEPEPEPEPEEQRAPGSGGSNDSELSDADGDQGLEASTAELGHRRVFAATSAHDRDVMDRIARDLPAAMLKTRARRRRAGHRGQWVDLRRTYARCRQTYGEVVALHWKHRPMLERRVLLMIDVSGSMKQQSADYLRFAHVLVDVCERGEVFTFGTRLTRVTKALQTPDVDSALAALSTMVLDADGGTRIGDSLVEFLSNARFVTMARDAVVIIISDGLERGDCRPMSESVARLRLLGHRLYWWSPLACDPSYRPITRGMAACCAHIDMISGVDDLESTHRRISEGLGGSGTRTAREHSHV